MLTTCTYSSFQCYDVAFRHVQTFTFVTWEHRADLEFIRSPFVFSRKWTLLSWVDLLPKCDGCVSLSNDAKKLKNSLESVANRLDISES